MRGQVVRVSGLQCLVEACEQQYTCELRGRLKSGTRSSNSPIVVGDWVNFEPTDSAAGVVEQVYPRRSKFSRGTSGSKPFERVIAANLDQLVVVVSAREPALRTGFIDRALVMALKGNVTPLICINKIDLDPDGEYDVAANVYRELDYKVCETSTKTGKGVDALHRLLHGHVSVFVGYSGVGKSSLLNRIDPRLSIETRALMAKHDRGRHATTCVSLYHLPQKPGSVADTPGIKELQLWEVDRPSVVDYFVEMAPLATQCRYRDCLHLSEPSCAIRDAVENDQIARTRYEGYRRIVNSITPTGIDE